MKFFRAVLNYIHCLIHAHRIAFVLYDCLSELGQMSHIQGQCNKCQTRYNVEGVMQLNVDKRAKLIDAGWKALPNRKWRT